MKEKINTQQSSKSSIKANYGPNKLNSPPLTNKYISKLNNIINVQGNNNESHLKSSLNRFIKQECTAI